MTHKATSLSASIALGALTVGAFALGTHLGPHPRAGRNLIASQPMVVPSQPGDLTLASTEKPKTLVAQNGQASASGDTTDDLSPSSPASVFYQVYMYLKRDYVDALPTDSKLGHGAASAMIASLGDPDSRFLEAPEMAALNQQAHGEWAGSGAVLSVRKIVHNPRTQVAQNNMVQKTTSGPGSVEHTQIVAPVKSKDAADDSPTYTEYQLTVVAVLPGSPADKAGLKSGDIVTDIDGQWIAAYSPADSRYNELKAAQNDPVAFNKIAKEIQSKVDGAISISEAQSKMNVPALKPLTVNVQRPDAAKSLALVIAPAGPTTIAPVTAKLLSGDIGYVKITLLTENADKDFATALSGLGQNLKGLIVDLRDSPGGLLEAGAGIAAKLTTATSLGQIQTKAQNSTPIPVTPARAVACPIVALIDGGTANASELIAATLKSSGAKLVGAKTFGDASDVKPIQLKDGSGFTMTVGQLLLPGGATFAGKGVMPDIAVSEMPGTDAPLARAVAELSGRVASAHR